jgi:hypothetical protein
MTPENSKLIGYAIGAAVFLLVITLRLRRMSQLRPLRLELMWIMPVVLLAAFASSIYAYRPAGTDWLWIAALAALGAAIGWYRGKMMQIHVDPQTHALNQKASPVALIFIVVIIAVRMALRAEAGTLGLDINLVTDAFVAFAAAMFTMVRVEMFIRARKLLAEARSAGQTVSD